MISDKLGHLAEAARVLDNLRPVIFAATTSGVPIQMLPGCMLVLKYPHSHSLLAMAYGDTSPTPAQMAAALAAGEPLDAPRPAPPQKPSGSGLYLPQ